MRQRQRPRHRRASAANHCRPSRTPLGPAEKKRAAPSVIFQKAKIDLAGSSSQQKVNARGNPQINASMRRHITPEDKARFVLLFIKSKKSVAALCKEHRISESGYYCWRKAFVLAGTVALRRLPKRNTRKAIAMRSRQEETASMERAKSNLLQCVEGVRTQSIDRRARLTKTARQKIFELIDDVAIPKTLAVSLASVARNHWRKIARSTNSSQEQQPKPKYIKLTDRDCVKEALFKTLHSPPSGHGFNRTTWTIDDLQQALRNTDLTLGKHAIRTIIRDAGYRWLKARKVLTSRDPEYRAKLDNIQRTSVDSGTTRAFFQSMNTVHSR
jgi:transposase-like protein